MQVILDSLFAHTGSATIGGGKKGEFRDWTIRIHNRGPFRKRSMPFLTVDALIGNQAFQNGRCHICFSLSLDKNKTGYNLLMALKCTHQILNPLTPGAFCQKCVIFGHFGGFEALIWPKMHLQHDSLPFLPLASRFTTFWLGRPRTRR